MKAFVDGIKIGGCFMIGKEIWKLKWIKKPSAKMIKDYGVAAYLIVTKQYGRRTYIICEYNNQKFTPPMPYKWIPEDAIRELTGF